MEKDAQQRQHRNGGIPKAVMLDWVESLRDVLYLRGKEDVRRLLAELQMHAQREGVDPPAAVQTPYVNTIPAEHEPEYPGDLKLEQRIEALIRWNAMAMVAQGNKQSKGIGGHISTFASIATLYEVGHNHFFRGPDDPCGGDLVYFQGHASPGNYARAFLEGRLSEEQLVNFRRELAEGGGLSSYPHPWLMPDFWQFPTVSMGLGPLLAVYQARMLRYMRHRGIIPDDQPEQRVWCFVGDGETDEPEALAAVRLASREGLDNLTFVINCNLQRLDGPVRGNGKIIQEMEATFHGAGWNVLKVIWGSEWDDLLARDHDGQLKRRMGQLVDGDYQKYAAEGGAYIREHMFGGDPDLKDLVEERSDEELWSMSYGGHDPRKIYAAYSAAMKHRGTPSVIIAKTTKGYGLGEAGEAHNTTHKAKELEGEQLIAFRDRFGLRISDEDTLEAAFQKPEKESSEFRYLNERRKSLGGFLPQRSSSTSDVASPDADLYTPYQKYSEVREVATTMHFVRLLSDLMKDKQLGERIVPIIPDEARTFGLDALFAQAGIYSHAGQLYESVDAEHILRYKEEVEGQILEEGITEAGSMASFIAAGTSRAYTKKTLVPIFLFYSMFGFQRVGDLIWAAGDSRARGFLIGCTAGRTTLNGEGLQHQDGHSHLLAITVPNVVAYDPAFGFEIAVIVENGLKRMIDDDEDVVFYMTLQNESYVQPAMPKNCRDGILKGLYRFRPPEKARGKKRVQLLGSGSILNEVLRAQEILASDFNVHADVWSATSYQQLHRDALSTERWNRLHPQKKPRKPHVARCLEKAAGPIVAASDYMKALPELIAQHTGRRVHSLGTDGFGRSDTRPALRDFFEVDHRHIVVAALYELSREGSVKPEDVSKAMENYGIDPETKEPARC